MKVQTNHTTPNQIRDENGIKVRSRSSLIRQCKEWREQYEVIGFDGFLRVRCKCGNELHYATEEEIPREIQACNECGYEKLLWYLGYTVPCPYCNFKNKFYDEYPGKDDVCQSCGKVLDYNSVDDKIEVEIVDE